MISRMIKGRMRNADSIKEFNEMMRKEDENWVDILDLNKPVMNKDKVKKEPVLAPVEPEAPKSKPTRKNKPLSKTILRKKEKPTETQDI